MSKCCVPRVTVVHYQPRQMELIELPAGHRFSRDREGDP
jgi:hypothetical protein